MARRINYDNGPNDHPTRDAILLTLDAQKAAMSPAQLSGVLGEPVPNVSFHCKVLLERECLKRAGQRQVRGAIEHFYALRKGVVVEDPAQSSTEIRKVMKRWSDGKIDDASALKLVESILK
jgi:predicted ArsR family transcriptional regulator